MPFKIKTQKDYFVTEVTAEIPADVAEVDDVLRATGTTGNATILYNQGGLVGISFIQKTKLTESQATKVRSDLGIADKII